MIIRNHLWGKIWSRRIKWMSREDIGTFKYKRDSNTGKIQTWMNVQRRHGNAWCCMVNATCDISMTPLDWSILHYGRIKSFRVEGERFKSWENWSGFWSSYLINQVHVTACNKLVLVEPCLWHSLFLQKTLVLVWTGLGLVDGEA